MTQAGSNAPSRVTVRIAGEVQGVGYRFFAWRRAAALSVRGYVRNLADGSVEVIAEGARSVLERLLAELRNGPSAARVDDLSAEWSDPTGEFKDFSIR